mgnify:CR=1 FL=1
MVEFIKSKPKFTNIRLSPIFEYSLEETADAFGEALALLYNVLQNHERDNRVHIVGEIREFLTRFTKEV